MSFLSPPKPPKPVPPPNPASAPIIARDSNQSQDSFTGASSLISTSPSGLRRKATTQRVSLIGG